MSNSVQVIIVNKNATTTPYQIKNYDENKLFKKCGFKSCNGFNCFTTWTVEITDDEKYMVRLYGKKSGKATSENKYEFPPPVDNLLLFGNVVLVAFTPSNDKVVNLTPKLWKRIEKKLFGGFETLETTEQEEIDELDDVSPSLKTKCGYLKDGFVVEDIKLKTKLKRDTVAKVKRDKVKESKSKPAENEDGVVAIVVVSTKKTNSKKRSNKTKTILPEKKEILLIEEDYDDI